MRMLIAPLHYVADPTEGSEYTRSFNYLKYLESHKDLSGDILVGFLAKKSVGNFTVHTFFDQKPKYISNLMRLRFIVWVYFKTRELGRKKTYDVIWHNGPFAPNETFSLVGLLNGKKIPFIIGPINTPHFFIGNDESRSMGKKIEMVHGSFSKFLKMFDNVTYFLARGFRYLSDQTLKKADLVFLSDSTGIRKLREKQIYHTRLAPKTFDTSGFEKSKLRYEGKYKLLNVSYLVQRKKTEDLLYALDILVHKKNLRNVILTIVGDGPEKEKLESLVKELSLKDEVTFVGFVNRDKISEYYSDAHLFVSASLSESMPSMYFEAMAAGLPLLITQNSSTEDLQREGVGVDVVESSNPQALAEAMYRSLVNFESLKEKGNKNYSLVRYSYNFDRAMDEFFGEFESILQNKSFL
jgi:glycosyltransferase involved in cell wall biosynthesis